MMNFILLQGHLTADPVYRQGQNGGKSSCWGRMGVYQGKDQQGNDLDSMFVEFTCFGKNADDLAQLAHKGDLVIASGRFTETKSIGNDGKEYINKKITGTAQVCHKVPTQGTQNVQYQQPQQSAYGQATPYGPPQYAQNPQYIQNPQVAQQNPWG